MLDPPPVLPVSYSSDSYVHICASFLGSTDGWKFATHAWQPLESPLTRPAMTKSL